MAILLARVRIPLQLVGFALIGVGILLVLGSLVLDLPAVGGLVIVAGIVLAAVSFVGITLAPALPGEPLALASPVRGRWVALNSPTTKVPSHGTHGYGQTYAVDLVFEPHEGSRPVFGASDEHFLPPERFPAFGRPLHSPADATVVRAHDRERDHRSRSSHLALALFFLESLPRELRGLRGVVGNHVVLRLADGSHVVFAHLKHDSLRVRVGDRVAVGQPIAECGNTGNSTEPHLHVQRQDVANTLVAAGLPWTIEPGGIPADGAALDGAPPA